MFSPDLATSPLQNYRGGGFYRVNGDRACAVAIAWENARSDEIDR